MKKGNPIPHEHRVMRFVSANKCIRDENNTPIAFFSEAFKPRPSDNKKLSVSWVEHYSSDSGLEIQDAANGLRANLKYNYSNCAFAVGKVKKITETAQSCSSPVIIICDKNNNNPSHTLVRPIDPDDASLLDALASDAFELLLNKDIPEL